MDLSERFERIENCPFCNSSHLTVVSRFLSQHNVYCNTCKSTGPREKSVAAAISNWNAISKKVSNNISDQNTEELLGRVISLENFVERMALDLYDNPS